MGSQLAKLQSHFNLHQGYRNHAPDDVSLGVQQNNYGSTPTLDAMDAIKMPTPCELVLPYGELDQKCAKGLVFPYGNGLIHTLPLRENHLKVMIDDIDSRYENFPLPVMTKEVANLQGAVGTVIQWPRIAIILAKSEEKKFQPQVWCQQLQGPVQTRTYPTEHPARRGRLNIFTNQVVNIVVDSGILEVGTYDFSVTCEEYFQLLRKQTTDASIITAWQLVLHSMVWTRMNKCAFLNPYNILWETCQKNPEGVVSYLVDSIRLHHGKLFLNAPYLQKYNNFLSLLLLFCLFSYYLH
uniref:DUF8039 domain-containing protein n=1 Tax=Lactuca sativa TaxID=4236 RepID=A0A9R1VEY8_LACSA|nr:hypothetical protein LSAT_V11C500228780 [Lactuca sativa]